MQISTALFKIAARLDLSLSGAITEPWIVHQQTLLLHVICHLLDQEGPFLSRWRKILYYKQNPAQAHQLRCVTLCTHLRPHLCTGAPLLRAPLLHMSKLLCAYILRAPFPLPYAILYAALVAFSTVQSQKGILNVEEILSTVTTSTHR